MKPHNPCVQFKQHIDNSPSWPGSANPKRRNKVTPPVPHLAGFSQETILLNQLVDQALEMTTELRNTFLQALLKYRPSLHRRLEKLLTGLNAEAPPEFLQPDELSATVLNAYYRKMKNYSSDFR